MYVPYLSHLCPISVPSSARSMTQRGHVPHSQHSCVQGLQGRAVHRLRMHTLQKSGLQIRHMRIPTVINSPCVLTVLWASGALEIGNSAARCKPTAFGWCVASQADHAMLYVGYNFTDPRNKYYIARNSWCVNCGVWCYSLCPCIKSHEETVMYRLLHVVARQLLHVQPKLGRQGISGNSAQGHRT